MSSVYLIIFHEANGKDFFLATLFFGGPLVLPDKQQQNISTKILQIEKSDEKSVTDKRFISDCFRS